MATVTGLSTDGSLLYVGTAGAGLLAFNVAAGTSALYNGNAPRDLPSSYINSTRVFGTQLFVASAAGLARPAVCGDDNSCGTTPTSPGGTLTGGTGSANPVTWSGGGGCSIGSVDEPDPVLWALVALALLQLGLGRLRQRRQALRLVPAQVRSDSARGLRP